MNFKPQKLPTLLLLTNNPIVRSFFDRVIEKLDNYALISASSRLEVLDFLDKTYVSSIVIDEKVSSIELIPLCKEIRQLPGYDRVPILVITGLLKKSFVRSLINAGATDFLREPLDEEEVVLRMEVASSAMETQAKMVSLSSRLSKEAPASASLENRSFLDDRATRIISQALNEKNSLALALMEIDQYPQILKTQGENVAHALTLDVEDRLHKLMRPQDLLYNQDHGKFVLFLSNTSCKAALFIPENIQEYLDGEIFAAGNLRFTLTASIGIATLQQAGDPTKSAAANLERLLKAATTCLSQAKQKKSVIITEESL